MTAGEDRLGRVEVVRRGAAASTRSTRGPILSRLVTGKADDGRIPALISLLFSLCPAAQASAWRAAAAAARGKMSGELVRSAAAAVQAEAMLEHAKHIAYDLPYALGIAPSPDAKKITPLRIRAARSFAGSVKDAEALLRDASDAVRAVAFGGAGIPTLDDALGTEEFLCVISRTESPAGEAVGRVFAGVPGDVGENSVPGLDPAAAGVWEWLDAKLPEPAFCTTPGLPSGPAQTNSWERRRGSAAVKAFREEGSSGCAAYLAARICELGSWARGPEDPSFIVRAASPRDGVGIGAVETARGLLIHRVEVRDGVVAAAASCAPTEWNFAPGGAANEALSSLAGRGDEAWEKYSDDVVRQFDPCIPCRTWTEDSNA